MVFFAAGVRHAPNWNWVWKAYRSLSRKYRKNLKRLVSVHIIYSKCAHLIPCSTLYTRLSSQKVSDIHSFGPVLLLCSIVLFSLAGAVVRFFISAVPVSHRAKHVVQPEVLSQNRIRRHSVRPCTPSSIDSDRYSTCCVSVRDTL